MAVVTVDFDGTLYRGNSFKAMFQVAKREFTVKDWFIVGQGLVRSVVLGVLKGKQALRHTFFKSFAKSFKDKTEEELEQFFQSLVLEGIAEVHHELISKIRQHQLNGDQVVVLSGALHPFLQAFIKELNLDVHVISTELLFDDKGFCTGEIGTIVNGKEKVRRIVDWLGQNPAAANGANGSLEELWAYADSEHDLPLLEFVNQPIVVNPNDDMLQIAKEKNWPIF
ncbi:HAD-IB family hydrolase [Salipaludibacillus keqinensis]|uniref:HAD-IB family hydrolase n=1 Tax=Salipaludibacillus keqinensis TaxID=2045207 RepID=A0A323TN07_9BACI|nr:HAD family hydrolase [Salipaludibacillus keqinensis]PYZ95047.1 HAD-IB family hydrolase [Salipaludibacillus keqinensis]